MKKILKELKPFKIPLLVAGGLLSIHLVLSNVLPEIQYAKANKTPIISIKANNNKIYEQEEKIEVSDFDIKAKHEGGQVSTVRPEDIKLSRTKPKQTGKYTEVTISLKGKKSISTTVRVKNRRDEITSAYCGNPKLKSVKVVLYSNGELAFEGKGDVLQYDQGTFPWQSFDGTIKSITFEETVTPTSLDYWFESMNDLIYIGTLPETVESIVGYCKGCDTLKEAPDWSKCNNLLDITSAYSDCDVLEKVPAILSTVRNATEAFSSCNSMQDAPDMSQATSLINTSGMFRDCKKLTTTNYAPAAEILDSMYESCINLKKAPEISETAKSMSNTFSGDISLVSAAKIPASVENVSGCYSNCSKLTGEINIDANPQNYGSFLANAANATKLNLKGNSNMLNILALTNDGSNISVNGAIPSRETE